MQGTRRRFSNRWVQRESPPWRAVTVALVGFFAFLMLRVTAPQMTPLFTDLSFEDSAAIVKDLERQGIPYELKNDGAIVLVPKDRVPRLRMKLAEAGLPKGGGVGYEIFDKSDALGATSFVQNINHLRALEGELARTIRAHRPGAGGARASGAARAAAVLARQGRSLRPRSCSRCAARWSRSRCARSATWSPRRSTASSPNGSRSSTRPGGLLADGARRRQRRGVSADERQAGFERRMREQVEAIVSSVVGPGRARVQLTADFDFNRITQTSEKFDPEGRVMRSSQTREESSAANDDNAKARSRVGNELPGRASAAAKAGASAREQTPQVRGNRQLRDFALDQDRSDRRRPRQPHLGRGAGRRHLRQERQGRDRLPAAREGRDRPHRRAGAHRHRLRPEARRPGRGRQPALRRRADRRRSRSRRASCRSCSSPRKT